MPRLAVTLLVATVSLLSTRAARADGEAWPGDRVSVHLDLAPLFTLQQDRIWSCCSGGKVQGAALLSAAYALHPHLSIEASLGGELADGPLLGGLLRAPLLPPQLARTIQISPAAGVFWRPATRSGCSTPSSRLKSARSDTPSSSSPPAPSWPSTARTGPETPGSMDGARAKSRSAPASVSARRSSPCPGPPPQAPSAQAR